MLKKDTFDSCKELAIMYFGVGDYDEAVLELREKGIQMPGLMCTKKEQIENSENMEELFWAIEKRNVLPFLDLLYSINVLTPEECGKCLYDKWTSLEQIHNNGISKTKLLKLMKAAPKDSEMIDAIENLSTTNMVQIYRGATDSKDSGYKGLSWTADKDKAIWFAKRFSMVDIEPYLYSAKIDKKYIFAFFEDRGESEIVCDYRRIKDLQITYLGEE